MDVTSAVDVLVLLLVTEHLFMVRCRYLHAAQPSLRCNTTINPDHPLNGSTMLFVRCVCVSWPQHPHCDGRKSGKSSSHNMQTLDTRSSQFVSQEIRRYLPSPADAGALTYKVTVQTIAGNPSVDPHSLGNYRPFSELPVISKVLNKLVTHLLDHLRSSLRCFKSQHRHRPC